MTGFRRFDSNRTLVQITKAVFTFCFAVRLLLREILVKLVKTLGEMFRELALAVRNPQLWARVSLGDELCVQVSCVVWVCLSINLFRKPLKLYLAIQSKHASANMIYATGDKKKNNC